MRTGMTRIIIVLTALAMMVVALVGCEEELSPAIKASRAEEFTFTVGESAMLSADTSNGEVVVRGVEGTQEVLVVATLKTRGKTTEEAEERLDDIVYSVTQEDNQVRLRCKASEQDRDVRRYSGVDFEVTVPIATRVNADTSNGAISVETVAGQLDLDTSNGRINVYEVVGNVVADTSNGEIEVWNVTGDVRADTSNGRIDLDEILGSVLADTSNGSITLESIEGEVRAETSNGSIRYEGRPIGQNNTLKTSNGSITVRIPADASIAFEVSADDGGIRSSLPLVGDTEGDRWSAELNPPATAAMSLSTSNGNIRIDALAKLAEIGHELRLLNRG